MKRSQEPADSAASGELPRQKSKFFNPSWIRKPPPPLDPKQEPLVLQHLEIDYHIVSNGVQSAADVPYPLIRMFCATEQGYSALVNVYGFVPYLYVHAPTGFTVDDCEELRHQLEAQMRAHVSGAAVMKNTKKPYIMGVEVLMSQSLIGYHGDTLEPFIKISTVLPTQITTLRSILEAGYVWKSTAMRTYESNILFPLRFMVDTKITGCGWLKLPAGSYELTPKHLKTSRCQIEVDVNYTKIENLGTEGEWSKIAPLRILSFDIECSNRKGLFPDPEIDPVIQIANLVTILGESKPIIRNIFSFHPCKNIPNAEVISFESESEMLSSYTSFIQACDPDIIIGYNIINFDIPYLMDRGKALKIHDFSQWGRIIGSPVKIKDSTFSSKAYGKRESKEIMIEGRVPFDIMQFVQREYKLRSFSLNFVSATFLGEQKEEVVHTDIARLWAGTVEERTRLAVYCLKDAYLPQRLCDKLMILINNVEMARVTGVPLGFLLPHGQQIKVLSQLYRKALEANLRIPYYKRAKEAGGEQGKYTGAVVIEPIRGFHDTPIATLDFASLYPSIMISHNICYSTLLPNKQEERDAICSPENYERSPNGDYFVKSTSKIGVLPGILQDLLSARKKAKQLLAKETDPAKRAVYDGRQLALKISANSVYGVTGARDGKLPCTEVAASVTSYGRMMIEQTKSLVEAEYCKAKGFTADAKVVYGDTDSVMVRFEITDMNRVIQLGKEAAAMVSQHFPKPVSLEFEKVYFPYLLISKKRYAGLLWTEATKPLKIDTKGIETVRRDNCLLVKFMMDTCLHRILIERNVQSAMTFVKEIIASLLQNKLDLSLLVISKALTKEGKDYGSKQAHVELARKLHQRDAASAPGIGDRVPYVIVQSGKGAKAYEKSEDPLYVLENNIPLDYTYYIENQMKQPIRRIFKPIMKDVEQLFTGDHTLTVIRTTPKGQVGGIAAFVTKTLSCLWCKSPLPSNITVATVCDSCRAAGKEIEVYVKHLAIVSELEQKYSRAWSQCQRCMESFHQTILCTNRDCAIFYMRMKVRKDLQEAQQQLDRFQNLDW